MTAVAVAPIAAPRPVRRSRTTPEPPPVTVDPVASAKAAGLRYVTDTRPGIRRESRGKKWLYFQPDSTPMKDADELQRIRMLAIPPAWTDVWICVQPNGHLQATGRDAKRRKQYRYHARWREARDGTKYGRLVAFGRALPRIRERTDAHLALPGLTRDKVLATVVCLLETTLIRVGNEEYAKANNSYGLTTMRAEHAEVSGSTVTFSFRGKSGKDHSIDIRDKRLARIVKRSQDLPGEDLFQYLDEQGEQQTIGSADVNEYLREISGEEFTAKDFRTWAGTVLAAMALQEFEAFDSETQAKRNIVAAIESVSQRLGNTPSVCRKCYVHPAVIDSYASGTMLKMLQQRAEQEMAQSLHDLRPEEAAVLGLLQQRLAEETA